MKKEQSGLEAPQQPEVNKDLFCLSINDVLSCTKNSRVASVKYLYFDKLNDLVKEKLKVTYGKR